MLETRIKNDWWEARDSESAQVQRPAHGNGGRPQGTTSVALAATEVPRTQEHKEVGGQGGSGNTGKSESTTRKEGMSRKEKRRRKRGQPKSKDAGAPKEGQKSQSPAEARGPHIGGETTGKTAESKGGQKAQPLARTQGPHVGSNAVSRPAGSKDRQRTQTPVKARGPHVSGKAANETAGPKGRVAESGRKQAEEGWIQVKSKAKGVKQAETRVDPNRRPVEGRLAGGRPGNRVEPTLGRKEPAQNHPSSNSSRPTQDSRSKGGLKASARQLQVRGPHRCDPRDPTAVASLQRPSSTLHRGLLQGNRR